MLTTRPALYHQSMLVKVKTLSGYLPWWVRVLSIRPPASTTPQGFRTTTGTSKSNRSTARFRTTRTRHLTDASSISQLQLEALRVLTTACVLAPIPSPPTTPSVSRGKAASLEGARSAASRLLLVWSQKYFQFQKFSIFTNIAKFEANCEKSKLKQYDMLQSVESLLIFEKFTKTNPLLPTPEL